MKSFFRLLFILLITVNAQAQYYTVTNTTGTVLYGTTNVTVVGSGTASSYASWCGAGPYWIGSGTGSTPNPGQYTFTFSTPASRFRVWMTAADPGESLTIAVNGTHYSLTSANYTAWTSTCSTAASILSGDTIVSVSGNSAVRLDVVSCGINSVTVATNGISNGSVFTFQFSDSGSCFNVTNNGPLCEGDTLRLNAAGASTGVSYSWTGPGGFTSTLQNPVFPNVTMADSGLYTCVQTIGSAHDTGYTNVVIHPHPSITASSNSPMCIGAGNTLTLFALPVVTGETFSWIGPNTFSSTLSNPTRTGFVAADTGIYQVIATLNGCRDTSTTHVILGSVPSAPVLSGITSYCVGETFIPFTVSGTTGTILWYSTSTGGTGSSTAPTVSTASSGTVTWWASQIIGGCESGRASITVHIKPTPAAPVVTGTNTYCQYVPYSALTATGTNILWYATATGGTGSTTQTPVNTSIPGIYTDYVSQTDSGCESPRTPFVITVNPKPAAPVVTPTVHCQFDVATALTVAGSSLMWYGPGVTAGYTAVPVPSTTIARLDSYYVTQTVLGCTSDSSLDVVRIKPQPAVPVVADTVYCQNFAAPPLAAIGTAVLWYNTASGGSGTTSAPVPPTATPGNTTWFATQTVDGCESPRAPLTVTVLYLPVFDIAPGKNFVCQFDTLSFSYSGPALTGPGYVWTLPAGASITTGTGSDPSIIVKFDSLYLQNVILTVSDYSGRCFTKDTLRIHVVPQPEAVPYLNENICFGSMVSLGLSSRSSNAERFVWDFDGANIIAANTNSGGPYKIDWNVPGVHIIKLTAYTVEGCRGITVEDTVKVHALPDAHIINSEHTGVLCMEDSVYFEASAKDLSYNYEWAPDHFFHNTNESGIWGRVGAAGYVTLTVTDAFGCVAADSILLTPNGCCTVSFPTAFTPNGDGRNDVFRPIFSGFHRFHNFRIANRWGQTVFESTNNVMEWDGTFGGVPQDMGVYYYFVKYDCDNGKDGSKVEKGEVTLIR